MNVIIEAPNFKCMTFKSVTNRSNISMQFRLYWRLNYRLSVLGTEYNMHIIPNK